VNEISEGHEIPEIEARIMAVGYFLPPDSEELKVISYGVSVRFCHLPVSLEIMRGRTDNPEAAW
jgi:hypothetical protein